MKTLKLKILILTIIAGGLFMTSCGTKTVKTEKAEPKIEKATDLEGPEYTSAYICPMYCVGSGSDEMGQCPACGMDYVVNEKKDAPGHEGHNH